MFLLLMDSDLKYKPMAKRGDYEAWTKRRRPGKFSLGKMTIRKGFLTIGSISWIIALMGCTKLGSGPIMGFGLIATTLFHGLILITVYRRKPLHRRIIERNVVDERIIKG